MSDYQARVDKAQQEIARNRAQQEIKNLPPGYAVGFDLRLDNNLLYVGPGLCNHTGRSVMTTRELVLAPGAFLPSLIPSNEYYLYITVDGILKADQTAPAYVPLYQGKYHPARQERYLNRIVYTLSDSTISLNGLDNEPAIIAPVWKSLFNDETVAAIRSTLAVYSTSQVNALLDAEIPAMNCLEGMALSNAADADHDITVSPGRRRSSDGATDIVLSSALTKRIDAAWVAGNDAGGLFSDTVAANTTYYKFVINNPTTGVVDAGFSTSLTAADAPSGFTKYRILQAIRTDGSANIIPGVWSAGNQRFDFSQFQIIRAFSATTTSSRVLVALPVPAGSLVLVKMTINANADYFASFGSPMQTDVAPSTVDDADMVTNSATPQSNVKTFLTNSSSQMFYRSSSGAGTLNLGLYLYGYYYDLGQYDYVA